MSTSTAPEPQPNIDNIDESARMAPGSEDVHDAIRDLLADEYPDLATNHGGRVQQEPFLEIHARTFITYFKFIFKTWAAVASSFVSMLSFEISKARLLFTSDAFNTDTRARIKAHTASGSS